MKQKAFISQNRRTWDEFGRLLSEQEANQKRLFGSLGKRDQKTATPSNSSQENFVSLYREVCHLQAMAKSRQYSSHLVNKLNDLVLRGHNILYKRRQSSWRQFTKFLVSDFPRLLRKNATFFWVATALFYVPALLFFVALQFQPEIIYSLLDYYTIESFEEMYNPSNDTLGEARDSETDFAMFGFYIYNNISVALRTFASGILLGVGSIFFLLVNGLLLGGVMGHLNNIGYIETISAFVIGHGSFELTAIIISGAAGMQLGFSLLNPGYLSRLEALKESSKTAIQLVYGAILMLVVAAFIEGFWSSSATIQPAVKYAVGAFLWLIVILYLYKSGDHDEA